jgi:hypothetical protein
VFTNAPRPGESYRDQLFAAALLRELQPACGLPAKEAIRRSIPNWNFSVADLPRYICDSFGREFVLQALSELEAESCVSLSEQRSIETYRYWLKANEKLNPPDIEPNT